MILGVKEFKVLKILRDRFVGRLLGGEKPSGEAKTPSHKKISLFRSPLRDVVSLGQDNPTSAYEATRIWSTRESVFWNWRRVAEYFRDTLEINPMRQQIDPVMVR